MTDIKIYNNLGEVVNNIFIDDTIEYVDGRVSKGANYYYKGIGIPYTAHLIQDKDITDEYNFIKSSMIFYLGSLVSKKCFEGKTGIFQERYQSHFTDWIGSCGYKELNILENLYDEPSFEKSSIDVLGYEVIDEEAQQFYLKVQYHCDRKQFSQSYDHLKLRELIDYMICTNWNFPWDKNCISDISFDGKVTDVGDLFYSEELIHKLGTVYCVLYSLGNQNQAEYLKFCDVNGLRHTHIMDYILNSIALLASCGVDIEPLLKGNIVDTYKHVVGNYLIVGKNCGFCGVGSCRNRTDENQSYGELIRQGYIDRVGKMLQ
jgi:hypothetical protein